MSNIDQGLPVTIVNLDKTIPFMQHRKSVRRYRGAYTATQFGPTWGLYFSLIFLWGLRVIKYEHNRIRLVLEWAGADDAVVWLAVGIIFLFLVLFLLVKHQAQYNIVESFYVTLIANILMLIAVISTWEDVTCWDNVADSEEYQQQLSNEYSDIYRPRTVIILLYIVVSLIIFVVKYFQRRVLPGWYKRDYRICRLQIKEQKLRDFTSDREASSIKTYLEQETVQSLQIKYVNPLCRIVPWKCQRAHRIQYIGMTDDEGRPHGFGIWKDSQWHGEHLIGKWTHGIPIGPFKSRETGSGSGFVTIRIPYFQCRGDNLKSFGYKLKVAPVTVGIANAECSISGVFFKDYPRITWMQGPTLFDSPEKLMYTEEYQLILDNQKKIKSKVVYRGFNRPQDPENPASQTQVGSEQPRQNFWQKLFGVQEPQQQQNIENGQEQWKDMSNQRQKNVLSRMVTAIKESMRVQQSKTCEISWLLEDERDQHSSLDAFRGAFQNLTGRQTQNSLTVSLDSHNKLAVSGYAPRNVQAADSNELKVVVQTREKGCTTSEELHFHEIEVENKQQYPLSSSSAYLKDTETGGVMHSQSAQPVRPSFNKNAQMIMKLNTTLLPTGREVTPIKSEDQEQLKEKYTQPPISKPENNQARLEIIGWKAREVWQASEAIIFVHGYNCSVEHGMKLFAQLLALGNFPAFMRPICFGWPNTKDVTYYQSQTKGAEAQYTHESLLQLLHGLGREGIDSVHIMAHSMGGRVVMSSVPLLVEAIRGQDALQNTPFQKPQDYIPRYKVPSVRIETCTLLNPEYGLGDFVNLTGPLLRQVCPVITIYGDKQDQALQMSETLNGLRRWWAKKQKQPVATPSWMEGIPGVRTEKDACAKCCPIFNIIDESVGHALDYVVDPVSGEPLDVDVIDTTFLESNIHSIRHNYFHVNKEVVEDLRELMLTKRRASQRSSRLEHTHGNVYGFLVAPSYVSAK